MTFLNLSIKYQVSSITSVIMPEISGVVNNIQLENTQQNLVDSHTNINVSMDSVVWLNYFFFFNKTKVILIFIIILYRKL